MTNYALSSLVAAMGISTGFLEGIVKVLAVLGGAAIGWLAIGVLVRGVGKWMAAKDVPRSMLLVVRSLGAVAASWVVWHMVFGPGGLGLFSGGSGGDGNGSGKDSGQATIPAESVVDPSARSRRKPVLTVVMMGGERVTNKAYYLILGEKVPRTLEDLQQVIEESQRQNGLGEIEILVYEDSVSRFHSAVKDLSDWGQGHDLNVKISFPKGEAP
jgi:hypothetical protein